MKTLKFAANLVPLVLSGEKTVTWRLFDDKDLQEGDELELVNRETGEVFARARITSVRVKKLGETTEVDGEGHEKYESQEQMLQMMRRYYVEPVTLETEVKIIKFVLN